jgi:arylsulfatase A-like enzyme
LVLVSQGVPPLRLQAAAEGGARPNIVLIIADDLGCEDCGPYGNPKVRTPNLDRLAREGMLFEKAFNACSSCSPSRSSIITGRYPHSTGAERLHMPLPAEQVTFVEKLKAAGYWTAQAGKWHLGPNVKNRFDSVNEGDAAVDGVRPDHSGCTQWLPVLRSRPKDKPFFLWLASFDPHRPYSDGTLEVPHTPEQTRVPPYLPDAPATRKDLAQYYDEIERLDGYVGRVLAELAAQGVAESTAVFFITDNGRPFPRCKTSVYDSGIQSPLLVRWPQRVKAGSRTGSLVSTVDLANTFMELAGLPPVPSSQGVSFAAVLTAPEQPAREYVFLEHNWHDYTAYERGVRDLRFKYIRNFWPELPGTPPADAVSGPTFQAMRHLRDTGELTPAQMTCFVKPRASEELYDVAADPHELKNLAADPAYAQTLARLQSALGAWRQNTADAEPSPRPPDTFDRETGQPLEKRKK